MRNLTVKTKPYYLSLYAYCPSLSQVVVKQITINWKEQHGKQKRKLPLLRCVF